MMTATRQSDLAIPGLRGSLRHDEPLSKHTVWACGGAAQRYFVPADIEDLAYFLRATALDEPLFWLGLGSNLLVRDGGIRGTVIALAGALDGIEVNAEMLTTLAGTPCAKVARLSARFGLHGGAFFAGIPGTMGGALAMNAGAFGGETWTLVSRVQMIDRMGELHWRPTTDFAVGYRHVSTPAQEWFVASELRLKRVTNDAANDTRGEIRTLLARRAETQPTGQRSCGSVFRNPPGDAAGRLIEAAGLKGLRIGGAVVSPKHANFIINENEATSADIEALLARVQETVRDQFGVELVPEVRIVGEPR